MKYILIFLLLSAGPLFGLDAEAIRKLAKQPHSRENLVEALKIFPEAREYRVTGRMADPGGDWQLGPKLKAKEKTVDGRYIVSEVTFPGQEKPMIMAVTFDKPTKTFHKWVLLPSGELTSATGLADFKLRTIAWHSNKPHGNPPVSILALEIHTDTQSKWRESIMANGVVLKRSEGLAVKIR